MQDRALSAIGRWQLEEKKDLEPVDLYIENMFPDKDWQILLLVFNITESEEGLTCRYIHTDIEKVQADGIGFRKYAYRNGSSRGGDVTFTTKLGFPVDKKLKTIKETTFKNLFALKNDFPEEAELFELVRSAFIENEENIKTDLTDLFGNFSKKDTVATGISFLIQVKGKKKYLRDFDIIKRMIINSGYEGNYIHSGTVSKAKNKISSVSGRKQEEVYGFAAPFKFSTPDKPGFISGFFNKKLHWRNYPIGNKEALELELGRKFIKQNLTGYFYSKEYMMVPNPIIEADNESLKKVIKLLKTAFDEEKRVDKDRKKSAEGRIQKLIGEQDNYFNLDILFFKEDKTNKSLTIELMLEEILPSRFRQLFIEAPLIINKNKIFIEAIKVNNEKRDLVFSYKIISDFFGKKFLEVVNKIFMVHPLDKEYVFDNIMALIRKNYNANKNKKKGFSEPVFLWPVLKAIMLLYYLQELSIITNNKNYKYMETENNQKQTTFDLERFNEFVKENRTFLDSDIKVGIFAVGVLVRFLFDIQKANLNNTPFEGKLHGYKLNPDLLMNVYVEALEKISRYLDFYAYGDLRDLTGKYFVVKTDELSKLSNNELSFYFVAGLELGRNFKRDKKKQ